MFCALRCSAGMALLAASAFPLSGQNTKGEFRPESDVYVNLGPQVRLVFVDAFNQAQSADNRRGAFTYYFDTALKPVFRRELRRDEDVFRQRYLTFRAGYQYTTSFVNGDSSSENRIIAESTWRAPLPVPGHFVLVNRNRGDFRFVKGKPFSMRYRNRIWVERDVELGRFVFTPYIYDEIFYETSKSAWVPNRYAAGVQLPASRHLVVEPYYLRQNDRLAKPQHVNAFGLKLNFYF